MQRYRFTYTRFTLASAMLLLCLRAGAGVAVPGHVEAWGRNLFGEATPPPGLGGVIAVAGGSTHSLALRTNGTVVAWGSDNNGQSTVSVPAGLTNVVEIAAGPASAAVKADGTVVIWGTDVPWLTDVPPEAVGVSKVKFVGSAAVALRSDGTVVAWGIGMETNVPPGLSDVIQIGGLNGHVLALRRDGSIVGWGVSSSGQTTHPPGLTNVAKVGGGQEVSMALRSDGTLFRWGSPFALPGDSPGLMDVIDFDLGNQHAMALREDGTVVAWGSDFAGQGTVPPLLNGVTAISAGGNHNLVITARPMINSITPQVSTTVGANVNLTVAASGEPLRYQWQHKGTNLPTGTNATLRIEAIDSSRAGSYAVFVSNLHGYDYAATSVSLPPPTITASPESRTVFRGEISTLGVAVSGFPPFTFQWFRNGAAMANETNATVIVPTSGREDSSVYRVTVTDSAGGATSSSDAVLTVFDPRPTSLTLSPVLDTSIFSSAGNPQGTATILSGTRANGIRDRGLLRFDFSAVPTNAVLERVSLRLRLIRAPRRAVESTFHLHRALKSWGAEATWENASSTLPWAAAGGAEDTDYSAIGIPGTFMFGSGELAFGETNEMFADISDWIQNPAANHGWFLISDQESTTGTARHFGSSESENPPTLLISYSIPAEVPTIRGMRRESTNFVFTIDGVAGWFYNIQTRDQVDRGIWMAFTNAPAGAGLPINITISMTNSHRFFRAFRN